MSDDPVGMVVELDSQIAVLTSVIQEKDRQVEELQHKLEDSTLTPPSDVSTVVFVTVIVGVREKLTDSFPPRN